MRLPVIGSVAFVLAGFATGAIAQGAGPAGGSAPVTVVNPLPLPVTGTVNVTGNVSVAAQEPFQTGTVPTFFNNGGGNKELIVVPAGKRLVIEGVSANVNVSATGGLSAVAISTGPGFDRVNELTCVPVGATANDLNHWFQCSTQVKFHAGPGSTVTFSVSTATGSSTGFYRAFASGYFVPAP